VGLHCVQPDRLFSEHVEYQCRCGTIRVSNATLYAPTAFSDFVSAPLTQWRLREKLKIASTTYARGFGILGTPTQFAYRLGQKCSNSVLRLASTTLASAVAAVNFEA
jgi:hypothetical protein